MVKVNPWLLGGGAIAVLLIASKSKAALMPTSSRDRDLDALADMLITETNFQKSKGEMAQIVYIAVNRARKQGKPIWFVVQPGTGPSPVWNNGPVYRTRFENASKNARWADARAFADTVLSGTSGFANTGVGSFVHPGHENFNMPCDTDIKAVRDGLWSPANVPGYGTRCIPKWAQGGKVVGTALFV